MKHYRTILLGFLALALGSCDDETPENGGTPEDNGWVLVWSDEFDTPTSDNRPNPSKWTYELGASGYGNNEKQNYTNQVKNASYETYDGVGCMKITALKDGDGADYSSARIKTEGLFEFRYGRAEARLKLPYGKGLWPAFWMLGTDYATNTWPACGEIDIMENKGIQPNIVSSALHMPGRSGGNPVTSTFGYQDRRFDTDFHVFAVEWDRERIDFIVDGTIYHRVEKASVTDGEWAFDHPFFIILNVAVGGDFGGVPDDNTYFPQSMYIDYVRVYQKAADIDPDANYGDVPSGSSINGWDFDGEDSDKGLLEPEMK